MRRARRLGLAAGLLALASAAPAQEILMDRGLRVAGLWCFPLASDSTHYVYLPSQAQLGQDSRGRPQFSFVRYVVNAAVEGRDGATITTARGGGILHFLVLYATPAEVVAAAQRELQQAVGTDARITGPMMFSDGRYALISSILNPAGAAGPRVLATGRASVLEGNRIALSFELEAEKATLLLKSFATATPDISLVFDMAFSGLSEAYDAELVVNWAEVGKSTAFKAGGSVYWVGADVETAFDEMRRNNAIQLRSSGSDEAMEGLLRVVYDKLLALMFAPVEPEQVPASERGGLLDALSALVGQQQLTRMARQYTGFGFSAGFRLKDLKSEGTSVLSFNHRATVERHATVVFNIGDFYARYGSDTAYFRAVNLADPTYQQREIRVGVDGALLPEFDRYINSVTVTLRKRHENGQETLQELVLDRSRFKGDTTDFRLVYGWNGDDDREAWLHYEYRTLWSFKGGGGYDSGWTPTDASMINVYAPYERRVVQVVGDARQLQLRGVRAVVVQVAYPFFDRRRQQQVVVRADQPSAEPQIEITLPRSEFAYDYAVTWQLEGGRQLTARRRDSSGLVFIDELPTGDL